ncbi:MAG: alpha/beta hydrolase [Alphaproteobacteria bacterium]|nr:alpha/beta hydrolase [Alphaproteobacteria bacterium]
MIKKTILAQDGHEIEVFVWPHEQAKAWVHIFHGMAEHALRYEDFAENLVAAGYAVVAHNHRGHGTGKGVVLGSYAEDNGWKDILADISIVRNEICGDELPYFVFGHSMGSFIAQSYLSTQPKAIAGVVLSGSNFQAVWLSRAGRVIARIERFRLGYDKSSKLLQFLSFGSFNQNFKPNRTDCDWLTRSASEVDKYIADPLSGFDCSTGLWVGFLGSLIDLFSASGFKKISTDVPIFILGGTRDPVGLMGKGLPKLLQAYEANGQKNVSLKLFENGRHEMLNEINKDEVYREIIAWLEKQN